VLPKAIDGRLQGSHLIELSRSSHR
jgi:hypothetical protein